MAQTLDQIIGELDAAYNPSRQAINDRINGIQGAENADLAGLDAQKNDAFGQITNEARSRGMGFSGIPLQEQAKYTASSFLPAVAKVKQSHNEYRNSLSDALNNMGIDQRKTAMSIRETQQNRDFEAEQARLAREAQDRAASAARSAAGGYDLGGVSGGGGGGVAGTGTLARNTLAGGKTPAQADADVRSLINSNNAGRLVSEITAISKSAQYGNTYDAAKLQLLQKYMPGWFVKAGPSTNGAMMLNANYINKLGQAGALKFKV
jgi:hypothetical protein